MVSTSHKHCINKQYSCYMKCSTLYSTFANSMLMFRLMFFHKNPPKRVRDVLHECARRNRKNANTIARLSRYICKEAHLIHAGKR